LLSSPAGGALVPSVVSFQPDLSYVVGKDALIRLKTEPSATVAHVKRWLGSNRATSIYGRTVFPDDVATLVVKSLKTSGEEASGRIFSSVLAAVPVNFSPLQERGLYTAFRRAGFSEIRLIPEPCAAALVAAQREFDARSQDDELSVLVIDLGGGTLDVAAVYVGTGGERASGLVLEVEAVDGDPDLGGMDYDVAIAGCIEKRLSDQNLRINIVTTIDRNALLAEAERAKIILNKEMTVSVLLGMFEVELGENKEVVLSLDRETVFKSFCALDERFRRPLQSVAVKRKRSPYYTPGKPWPDVIMLAGQGTKLQNLRHIVADMFPQVTVLDEYQDSAVVRGLGLYLRTLSKFPYINAQKEASGDRTLLINVFGRSYGVKYAADRSEVLSSGRGSSVQEELELQVNYAETENDKFIFLLSPEEVIPTIRSVKVAFQDGTARMSITVVEKTGSKDTTVVGTIVLERRNYDLKDLYC
jgi:molecular chaperone DnaK (HSP70)